MRFTAASRAAARRQQFYVVGAPARPAREGDHATPPAGERLARIQLSRAAYAWVLVAGLALGVAARASWVLAADFPVNDGGLFYVMTRDLQDNAYRLPVFTTYNGGHIPFAYAPLGFYAAAVLEAATPMSMLTVFRFLPLALAIGTVGAFLLLARSLVRDRLTVAVAVFGFALLPQSYEWLVMGGGVTRGFGLLFSLLAIHQAHALYTTRRLRHVPALGLLAGLTLLSHIEMGWWTAWSVGLFLLFEGRHRTGVLGSLAAAAIGVAVAAPWLVTVLAQHGTEPFIASMHTGVASPFAALILFSSFQSAREPFFPIFASLAMLGLAVSIVRRQYLLPAWVLLASLVDTRSAPRVGAPAVALLAAVAFVEVLLPLFLRATSSRVASPEPRGRFALPRHSFALGASLVMLGYAAVTNLAVGAVALGAMPAGDREAMAWVAQHTPPGSRFVLVTGSRWGADYDSEWFPALAGRTSIATVQGTEWLSPPPAFSERIDSYQDLQRCGRDTAECLDAWQAANNGAAFDYVFVGRNRPNPLPADSDAGSDCCSTLRTSLSRDRRYRLVFGNEAVTIFARNGD
jgi:hypothetical protein